MPVSSHLYVILQVSTSRAGIRSSLDIAYPPGLETQWAAPVQVHPTLGTPKSVSWDHLRSRIAHERNCATTLCEARSIMAKSLQTKVSSFASSAATLAKGPFGSSSSKNQPMCNRVQQGAKTKARRFLHRDCGCRRGIRSIKKVDAIRLHWVAATTTTFKTLNIRNTSSTHIQFSLRNYELCDHTRIFNWRQVASQPRFFILW